MDRNKRDGRFDWRGVLIASAFIALMYVDFFLWRGGPSGLVVGGAFSLLGLALIVRNVRMIRAGRLACQLTGASRWVIPIVLLTAGAGVLVLVALRSVT